MNPKIKRTDFGVFVMVDDSHLSRWVENHLRLDVAHEYLERFKEYIPVGGTVIDCGTCIGDHTVTYASYVGPTGKVIGFEANPDAAECCALNLAIYPWAKVYNIGLSDDYGVCGIDIEPNVGASKLIPNGREVKLAPLDSFMDEMDRCDFIKVDVEGFEPRVIKGSEATIFKFHPIILMEINAKALDFQGFTPDHVFEAFAQIGYGWQVADGKAGSEQYDILAFPKK